LDGPVPLSNVGAGINRDLGTHLYLTEAYVAPYVGCWQVFGAINTDCTTYGFADSTHIDVGEYSVFDILPATLSGFYTLNWSSGNTISFPEQIDQDGDGLLIGTDPYPTQFDGDGDGLSDYFEIANGFDAQKADGDGDGLTDSEELRRGLNPRLADTDDDGLSDKTEWEGWAVVYDYEPDGTPLLTWAWPNPFTADYDEDRLSDQEESFYALHPLIPSNSDAILDTIQFSDGEVRETAAPLRLFRFDEAVNATSFLDNAERERAFCDGSSCPTSDSTGRYNVGLDFDGSDDYLKTGFVLNPASSDFTAALWFKVNDLSVTRSLVQQQDGSGTGRSWLSTNPSGKIETYIGGSQISSGSTLSTDTWHHAAVTYSGGTVTLYLDGQVEQAVSRTPESSNGDLVIGIWKDLTQHPFDGSIDELIIYDSALDATGINNLMNAKYNVSDLVVAPGDSIDVQLTISNTNPVYPAQVVYYGDAEAFTNVEAISPTFRLRVDESSGATSFSFDNGAGTATCNNGAGECPTAGHAGVNGTALYFDSNDVLNLDTVLNSYAGDGSWTISFWF
ncbi:MAG: LamG-like jellyroll fold domain-containing protein, partial [Chloroflexota bacterium]